MSKNSKRHSNSNAGLTSLEALYSKKISLAEMTMTIGGSTGMAKSVVAIMTGAGAMSTTAESIILTRKSDMMTTIGVGRTSTRVTKRTTMK